MKELLNKFYYVTYPRASKAMFIPFDIRPDGCPTYLPGLEDDYINTKSKLVRETIELILKDRGYIKRQMLVLDTLIVARGFLVNDKKGV